MLSRLRARLPADRLLLVVLLVAVTAHTAVIAHRRLAQLGDFDVSREFGRRLLAGEPLYAGGLHYPYMPSAALYWAPLALLPPGLGLALRYGVALLCLWLTLRLLFTMVAARDAGLASQRAVLAGLTLLLASHYVLRDLDDGGPHLILLAMAMGGVYGIWRGRAVAAAAWLGLAAALKAPYALFLPWLVWKREWRLAALTAAALAAWTLLPMLWMGPASWSQQQREWLHAAVASASGAPSGGARDSEERVQNQGLRTVLARYAASAADPRRSIAPQRDIDVPRAAWTDRAASAMATLVPLALLALVAWWGRPPVRDNGPTRLVEFSAVLILSVLLSPVAWVQHCVVAIPALYLIAAAQRGCGLSRTATAAMLLYVLLAVLLNRELLGRGAYLVLLAHGLHTACMLIVLAVLVLDPGLGGAAPRALRIGAAGADERAPAQRAARAAVQDRLAADA